jgi:hypothetical protein
VFFLVKFLDDLLSFLVLSFLDQLIRSVRPEEEDEERLKHRKNSGQG